MPCLRSATAKGLVYTTSTFESGGTENKILTLSPGCENHQNRPHRDELGFAKAWPDEPFVQQVVGQIPWGTISGFSTW